MKPDVLVAVEGPSQGMSWPLTGSHVVGREGDIVVGDAGLSRRQLELRATRRTVMVRDLGSTNGTRHRFGVLRRGVGPRWQRVVVGSVLEAGEGRYRLGRHPRPRRAGLRTWHGLTGVAMPVAVALAMVPFAVGGPGWRWLTVAMPLVASVGLVRRRHTYRPHRPERPADILATAAEGRAFHAEPVLPRSLRPLRSTALAGTGWAFVGPAAERNAMWLAGFLVAHNDPDVLRVTSPWVTTRGLGIEVVLEPRPPAGPGRDSALVTWHASRPPVWAAVLRAPAWAQGSLSWLEALGAGTAAGLPVRVELAELLRTDTAAIRQRWRGRVSLAVPVGVTASGPLVVDLERDGPHALVAGMSGAGKSEFLTTWLLALALGNPPGLLQFILVDFKGGAAFDVLAGLPHCMGVLTDLDEGATRRALQSLRAQLRRREQTLRAHGSRDITDHNQVSGRPLPRLVVVIDEYRALADDHPDLLEQFLRLANQGRSLGIHLIVGTQRPAGAVGPELRANMPLRVCLRVAERPDSLDVLGVPDAATLEKVPGRALVHAAGLTAAQIAWSGQRPDVLDVVARIRSAADGTAVAPPWQPPLPALVAARDFPADAVALADHPSELDQRPVTLPDGGLLILGTAGSGRSGAAHTAASVALAQGDEVWLVSSAPAPCLESAGASFGGVIDPRQTRVVSRLLNHVTRPGRVRRTVVLDDVETWIDTSDALVGPGHATGALAVLLRSARASGARLIITAPPAEAAARWAEPLRDRIFLHGTDPATALLAGLPREAVAGLPPSVPGRGLLMPGALTVQILLQSQVVHGRLGVARRFPALPLAVAPSRAAGRVVLGSDGETVVDVAASGDFLVVGPPGTGRSATARLIHGQYPEATIAEGSVPDAGGPLIATVTPSVLATAWAGRLARLRTEATIVLLRPDLYPRLPGLEYTSELEPGTPGYAVVISQGSSRALRVAR